MLEKYNSEKGKIEHGLYKLNGTKISFNSSMYFPNFNILAEDQVVEIRLKNMSDADKFVFAWGLKSETYPSPTLPSVNVLTSPIEANSDEFKVYTIHVGQDKNWKEVIKFVKFSFNNNEDGEIHIDYIKIKNFN